jgi:hypothetical protein
MGERLWLPPEIRALISITRSTNYISLLIQHVFDIEPWLPQSLPSIINTYCPSLCMPEGPEGSGTVEIVESAKGSGLSNKEVQDLECKSMLQIAR